jgi:UDP-GlcNAc:undecaprenyl-phosphate/decaprenyl-phosphate GlcNAc-1-phosphate transferase
MYDVILGFITSFSLTYLLIPNIIKVAKEKHLYDVPDARRAHQEPIPRLGGIAIFAGVVLSVTLWTPFQVFADLQYILCAMVVIFLIGFRDDITSLSPAFKFLGQLFAACILVFKANIKLTSLYGILGVYEIPDLAASLLSIFTILVIINSFNLIDGINGLSGSIAVLITSTLGVWFLLTDHLEIAVLAFSLTASIIAFLKYNFTPARIFMGDTGSLLIGMVCSILTIKFIELHRLEPDSIFAFQAVPAVAVGILILPLFDTLRVFTMRLLRGRSPMSPDRNHIHHLLIDSGLNHMQATGILVAVNLLFIFMVLFLQSIGTLNLLVLILFFATLLTGILFLIARKRRSERVLQTG